MLNNKINFSQTKDDLFLNTLRNKQLIELTRKTQRVSHTYEFQQSILHDRNFNNIQKTVKESWAAAIILRNADVFGKTIYELSKTLSKIWSEMDNSEASVFFVNKIKEDVDKEGQFARIFKEDIASTLSSSEKSAKMFSRKILLIKSLGAFIVDHASKDTEKFYFLFKNNSIPATNIIQNNRPEYLFRVRGRSGVMSNTYRKDIGILDSEVFDRLDERLKKILTINGLTKDRPLFRTRISDKLENGAPAFVERMFDLDKPLIASISGSTACIFIAADVLDDKLEQPQLDQITLAAIALFVGGGYHSVNEIINIRSPHINYFARVKEAMEISNKELELKEYIAALEESQKLLK